MKKFTFRKFKIKSYQKKMLEYLSPPEDLTVSQWAEKSRVLDIRSSAIPGKWRNSVTPYLTEIMDCMNNPEIEEVVFVKPTQVGGTEALFNQLGYIIAQDPGPTMIVYPTDSLGDSTSENRIIPMLKASPDISKHFFENSSAKKELQFDNMYVTISGANSPASLASKPIRYLFLDEVDKYPAASKREADPISLARERTKTFHNCKIYMCSTPTLRTGHIWKAKEDADALKHYFVPCPHCGEYIELLFSQLKWPDKEQVADPSERAEQCVYVCQKCGVTVSDAEKNLAMRTGEWKSVAEKSKIVKKVAYQLNTLYSPFVRFSEIAKEFMRSKDDPELLHNFLNSWLAEPWEDTKLKTSAELVLERQTELEAYVLPPWTKILTGGVDVQENCLYWSVRAFGDYITSQNVAHGQAFSFSEIENIMNLEFKKENGDKMAVELVLVDSGDQTDEVYDFCAINSEWAVPCKGTGAQLSHYKISTVNKTNSRAYGMTLVLVDGGKYKDMIASRMRKPNGKGSWMVHRDCDMEYARQVTAEHKVNVRNGKGEVKLMWQPKTENAPNHYLDCEVYALAAADIKGVRALFLNEEAKPKKEQNITGTGENNEIVKNSEEQWIRVNENWV